MAGSLVSVSSVSTSPTGPYRSMIYWQEGDRKYTHENTPTVCYIVMWIKQPAYMHRHTKSIRHTYETQRRFAGYFRLDSCWSRRYLTICFLSSDYDDADDLLIFFLPPVLPAGSQSEMYTLTTPVSIKLWQALERNPEAWCFFGVILCPQIWEEAVRQGRATSEWSHMIQTTALYLIPHGVSWSDFTEGSRGHLL